VSKIAPGWSIATVSEITEYLSRGKQPKYVSNSSLPVINQKAIRLSGIQTEYLKYVDPEQFDLWTPERFIRDGDVLCNSTGTGTLGRVCLITQRDLKPPKVVDSHVTIIRPDRTAIDPRFLFFWIQSSEVQESIASVATGATNQIELSRAAISSLHIPIAPLNEQKRIADNLDRLITRVDDCRDRLDRISLILKRFRQSVLLLAMSGELTADWRKVSQESVEWRNVMLSEICISIVDGTHQAPPQTESGIPFITISAINDGRLRIEKATRFVSSLYFEQLQPSRKPVIGDILFSVTGSIAITALVDVSEPFIFQRHIAILKPDSSQIVSKFLFYVLNSENIKRQSQEVATGTAQKTISISRLRAFEIDLPSIDEQIEVVNRIESLFSYADLLEERYKKAYIQVEQLTPTLLNMAFRGELVPQDPDDEPASVLLERIQISKAAQPIEPRVPTTRRSTMTRLSQESVKEVICQLPNDEFSFEELREKISGDYDLLKDIFFTLLDETDPIVKQVFNREAETMCFVRGSK
jgi:type I restriction enzyme, S subunit